jgi:hypothetical protein
MLWLQNSNLFLDYLDYLLVVYLKKL